MFENSGPAASQVLRGKPDGALLSADVVFHCRKTTSWPLSWDLNFFPLRRQNSCWTWKTVSWCEHAKCLTAQDPFPNFIKLKWARIPQSGLTTVWFWTRLVPNPTGLLTWVCFDVVHLVEILRDKKLLQTNTDKRNKSQIKHPLCLWLFGAGQIFTRNQKF